MGPQRDWLGVQCNGAREIIIDWTGVASGEEVRSVSDQVAFRGCY